MLLLSYQRNEIYVLQVISKFTEKLTVSTELLVCFALALLLSAVTSILSLACVFLVDITSDCFVLSVTSSSFALVSGLYVFTTTFSGILLKVKTSFPPFWMFCIAPPGTGVSFESLSVLGLLDLSCSRHNKQNRKKNKCGCISNTRLELAYLKYVSSLYSFYAFLY